LDHIAAARNAAAAGMPPPPLLRLNFLAHLLPDAFEYCHQHLCGSVLGVHLGEMPFTRDVALSRAHATALLTYARFCRARGLPVFVTPESRCSLLLQAADVNAQAAMASTVATRDSSGAFALRTSEAAVSDAAAA